MVIGNSGTNSMQRGDLAVGDLALAELADLVGRGGLVALQLDPGVDLFAASACRPAAMTLTPAPSTACRSLTPPNSPSHSCAE